MDKKSKILIIFTTILILISIGASFYKYVIKNDYYVYAEIDCDPNIEDCFVSECELDDTECEEYYYKGILRKSYTIEYCNAEKDQCEPLSSCSEESTKNGDCVEILCNQDNQKNKVEIEGICAHTE